MQKIHETAESFLEALAQKGGVIVSSGDMSPCLISIVQNESDWFVLPSGLGFGRLDKWNCPEDTQKQVGPKTTMHVPV